jgi:hypothetical protein
MRGRQACGVASCDRVPSRAASFDPIAATAACLRGLAADTEASLLRLHTGPTGRFEATKSG